MPHHPIAQQLLVWPVLFVWLLPAVTGATPSSSTTTCDGELLYNGLCLKAGEWPPRFKGSPGAPFPPRDGRIMAPYIANPPAVINVTLGRQLFVDPFLVQSMPGLQLLNHAAEWQGRVLPATEPWESTVQVPQNDWPQSSRTIGYANPFSGGVWWDETHRPPCYRAWYVCGAEAESPAPGAPIPGCCYAESANGINWTKPVVGTGGASGTNIVLQESFDGNVVWLDHAAKTPEERYVMATIPKNLGYSMYHILTSADGAAISNINEPLFHQGSPIPLDCWVKTTEILPVILRMKVSTGRPAATAPACCRTARPSTRTLSGTSGSIRSNRVGRATDALVRLSDHSCDFQQKF